jgi:class 3 adenylate cyclase
MLGEQIWDELSDAFLFEFMATSEVISLEFEGTFEDQGDGFKILFQGDNHVGRAVACGALVERRLTELRRKWGARAEAFNGIGLGIGICTDCMSIQEIAPAQNRIRVASHAINIAAAIAKYQMTSSDVGVYLDETAASMLRSNQFNVEDAQELRLDRLGRTQVLYKLMPDPAASDPSSLPTIAQSAHVVILFLASDPSDAARLRLGEEAREIQEKLQMSRHRERFIALSLSSATRFDPVT